MKFDPYIVIPVSSIVIPAQAGIHSIVKSIHKSIVLMLIAAFISTSLYIPQSQAGEIVMPRLPAPGVMVHLSPEFIPAHLQGLTIHPDNALQFDFLINKGDGPLEAAQKQEEYTKLVKYFLASLTIPDEDQWVNLSPYEHNRIIKDDFGKTEMGRDLLSQDYLLKQITSSLMYPESGLGKTFWDKVYERAYKEYGTTDIPVNTFNKVWIIPDEAAVYESGDTVYILRNHLKVMLEEDYLSLEKHSAIMSISPPLVGGVRGGGNSNNTHSIASKIVKEIILPELEKEVNEGKNFAMLRQIYSGMILATWYKHALKESLLGRVYANKARVAGLVIPASSTVIPAKAGIQKNGSPIKTFGDDMDVNAIYQQYLKAFKKGVFNYIKEDTDKYSQQIIPRKYFAGGIHDFASVVTDPAALSQGFQDAAVLVFKDMAEIPALMLGKFDLASVAQVDQASVALNSDQDQRSDQAMTRRRFVASSAAAGLSHAKTRVLSSLLGGKTSHHPKPNELKVYTLGAIKNGDITDQDTLFVHVISNEVAGLNKWLLGQVDEMAEAPGISYFDALMRAHRFGIKTGLTGYEFKGLFKIVEEWQDPKVASGALDHLFKIAEVNTTVLNGLRHLKFHAQMMPYADRFESIGNISAIRWNIEMRYRSKPMAAKGSGRRIEFSNTTIMKDFEDGVQRLLKMLSDKKFADVWNKFKEGKISQAGELAYLMIILRGVQGPLPEEIRTIFKEQGFADHFTGHDFYDQHEQIKLLLDLKDLGDQGALRQLKELKYKGRIITRRDFMYVVMDIYSYLTDAKLLDELSDHQGRLNKNIDSIEQSLSEKFPTLYKEIARILRDAQGGVIEDRDFWAIGDLVLRRMIKAGLLKRISDTEIRFKDVHVIKEKLNGICPEEAETIMAILDRGHIHWDQVAALAALGNQDAQRLARDAKVDEDTSIDTLVLLWRDWGNRSAREMIDSLTDKRVENFNKFYQAEMPKDWFNVATEYEKLHEIFIKTNSNKAYQGLLALQLPQWISTKGLLGDLLIERMVLALERLGNPSARAVLSNWNMPKLQLATDVRKYLDFYKKYNNASALRELNNLTMQQVASIRVTDDLLGLLDLEVPAAITFLSSLDDIHIRVLSVDSPILSFRQVFTPGVNKKPSAPTSMLLRKVYADSGRGQSSPIKKGEILEVFTYFSGNVPQGYTPLQATVSFLKNPSSN